MTLQVWIALAAAHCLGAMSPGPSLALILRNTLKGGRRQGVITGIGHGVGFGVYATLAATSLATALTLHPATGVILKWAGIALLIYLGWSIVRHALTGPYAFDDENTVQDNAGAGFVQGFLLAIFNPKILAWMLAIYAPFLNQDLNASTIAAMVIMGMVIDGGWYVLVALVLSRGAWIDRIRAHAHRIDLAMGALMFVFAGFLLFGS